MVDTAVERPALTDEESAELALRNDQIAFYRRTLNLLISERNLYMSHLLASKGLDPALEYSMDPETRELTEAPKE